MPCFKWVRELAETKAHAIATAAAGTERALCGRTMSTWVPFRAGDPVCEACTSRDEEIHRTADHKAAAPRAPLTDRRPAPTSQPSRGHTHEGSPPAPSPIAARSPQGGSS